MIQVKVLGTTPPCAKCKAVEAAARKAAEKYPGQVEVTKFDILSGEARKYKVMLTPAVVINDKVLASGKVISEAEDYLKKY